MNPVRSRAHGEAASPFGTAGPVRSKMPAASADAESHRTSNGAGAATSNGIEGTRGLFIFVFLVGLGLAGAIFAAEVSEETISSSGTPSVPNLESATAVSACAVELKWNQADNADYFNFKVNTANPTLVPGVSGSGDKSFTHTELIPAQSYTYQVQACASVGGCSVLSNSQAVSTPAIPMPALPPTNLQVTAWEASGGRAVLSWTPSATPANSGFRIFHSDDGGATFTAIATISLADFQSAGNKWKDAVTTDALHIYKVKTYQTATSCTVVMNDTPEAANFVKFSSFSSELVVPARPASVSVKETRDNRTKVKFQWDNVAREDVFRFEMSEQANFQTKLIDETYNADVVETPPHLNVPGGFITVQPDKTFYYRIRACAGGSCSDYRAADQPYVSGLIGPRDLSASAAPRDVTVADVILQWTDAADYYHRTRIYRKLSTVANFSSSPLAELSGSGCFGSPPVCTYPTSYTDGNRALENQSYDYQVKFLVLPAGTEESEPSNTASVNLNLTFLDQWGWSGGLGWVRLAWDAVKSAWGDAVNPPNESQFPYSVSFNNATGILGGYAWSNGGWLSFNEGDCPQIPDGGEPCDAKVDLATGKISGWAKFTAADPSKGAWHGWVSLSSKSGEPAYGLMYDTTTKQFTGYAWGGDVTGWLAFGDYVPPPRIIQLTPSETSVEVRWENPTDYQSVRIYRSEPDQPNDPKDLYNRIDTNATSKRIHTEIVPNLTPDTEYGFFIRGFIRK